MRLTIRVQPAAGRTVVGGRWEDPRLGPLLVVRVAQPAVDGRAAEAALRALATALGVRRADVTLVRGAAGRAKTVDVDVPSEAEAELRGRLDALGARPG